MLKEKPIVLLTNVNQQESIPVGCVSHAGWPGAWCCLGGRGAVGGCGDIWEVVLSRGGVVMTIT